MLDEDELAIWYGLAWLYAVIAFIVAAISASIWRRLAST